MTVIKPVSLSYMCINLAGLHSGIYSVGLVVYKPIVLRRLFLDFFAIIANQIIRFNSAVVKPQDQCNNRRICYCSYCGRMGSCDETNLQKNEFNLIYSINFEN